MKRMSEIVPEESPGSQVPIPALIAGTVAGPVLMTSSTILAMHALVDRRFGPQSEMTILLTGGIAWLVARITSRRARNRLNLGSEPLWISRLDEAVIFGLTGGVWVMVASVIGRRLGPNSEIPIILSLPLILLPAAGLANRFHHLLPTSRQERPVYGGSVWDRELDG